MASTACTQTNSDKGGAVTTRTVRVWTAVSAVTLALTIMFLIGDSTWFAASLGVMVVYGAFWAAVIAGGIWLATKFINAMSPNDSGGDAIEEVKRRYARGEIDRAEFFQMKRDLEGDR